MIDTTEAAARALDLLRRAAAATDAGEHAGLLSDAVSAVLDQRGQLSAEDRDALIAAGNRALEQTLTFKFDLSPIRLHLGSMGAAFQVHAWALSPSDRALTEATALGRNMRNYAVVCRNDFDTAAQICALEKRIPETIAEGSAFVVDEAGLPQIGVAAPAVPVRLH